MEVPAVVGSSGLLSNEAQVTAHDGCRGSSGEVSVVLAWVGSILLGLNLALLLVCSTACEAQLLGTLEASAFEGCR